MPFFVSGARDCAPCQILAKREGFVTFPKTMAGVGHLKRICQDEFSVAGAVQEKIMLRDRCSTADDLASYFRQVKWKNRKGHWYEAVHF